LPLRHSLNTLLSLNNFVNGEEAVDSVRNQLASISQRLSRAGRTDLEARLKETEKIMADVEKDIARQASLEQLVAEQKKELEAYRVVNEELQRSVDWYTNTYEKRSLPGIVFTRTKNFTKRLYTRLLRFLLSTSFVQNRYAVRYMLEYTRDNGLRMALKSVRVNVRQHGFKAITNARQLALAAIQKAAAAKAPKPADPTEAEIYPVEKMKADILAFAERPLISVIMPTYNTKPALLDLAIRSVQDQVYDNWELCIVDDGSTSGATLNFLQNYPPDQRIKVRFLGRNSGIAAASNECIAISSGSYLALFDHDDELAPDALFWVCKEINDYPATDIIYTDECKKDEEGLKSDYFLKPGWSPQLLLNMMYVGHLTVYNKRFLLSKVGVFRSEYDFSQDYDLMLRATEHTQAIRHISRVLYYWRQTEGSAAVGDKPYARQTNISAVEDAIRRRGIQAEVTALPTANRVKVITAEQPLVSIIIPTDSLENLVATIESIAAETDYRYYEIVPVTNSAVIARLSDSYHHLPLNYVPYDKPYNFSDKCNAGAAGCNGSVIIFLNDDVRPLQPDWIQNTIEYLQLPGVGGVSPKLIYEDDSIQYAGMVTGVRNLTGTSFHCYPRDSTAYINFPQLAREVSILSGACLAMTRDLFRQVGGFDAVNTPSAHSDVDLSFKLIEAGYRCIYTPYAELRHIGHLSLKSYEAKEKKRKKDKADLFLLHRWPEYVASDPWFPSTMRDLLYHDSPEPYTIYPGRRRDYVAGDKDVLLVCHDLTRSGAPIMLYNIATVLLAKGYNVVVCCAKDGPLRDMYRELGITVIIDSLMLNQHPSFERFAINFDYILCNTVVNWPIVRQMQNKVKTIWWLQEAKVIDHFINEPDFISTLIAAKNIIGVSNYSLDMIKRYNRHYTKIYNACYDFYHPDEDVKRGGVGGGTAKIVFAIVGSIESRKGHDVLFDALELLGENIVKQIEVQVIGRVLDPAFNERIRAGLNDKDYIRFMGEISNAEAMKLVADTDVIVCPSRDDPFPVVLVEGFCMAKTCIVSDHTGFAELIVNGENGFVFPSEDAQALAAIMRNIVMQSSEIKAIGRNAREVYLRELSIPVLEDRLLTYFNDLRDPEAVNFEKKSAPGKAYAAAAGR
jgi:GT2 family glycosyltransferase